MKEIIDNSADTGDTDAKRNKIMARDQKLVLEAKEKIEKLEQEETTHFGQ